MLALKKHYMHSQHIVDTATMEILLPPWNTRTPLFYGLSKKYTSFLSTLLFQDMMVQLTLPLPILLASFILLANNLQSHLKNTKHFLNLI